MSKTAEHISIIISADSKSIEDEKTRPCYRSIISEFFLNTSIHGLPRIARSQGIHNRIFWSVSFIIFTTIMVFFVIQAAATYFAYPTNVNVKIISEWPQYFPAFTFCNAAPLCLERFMPVFFDYLTRWNLTNETYRTTLSAREINYIWSFVVDIINKNESIQSFFFPLPSMLYKCSFNHRKCSATDFIPFISAYYGYCYTFNAKMKSSENKSVRYSYLDDVTSLDLGLYVHSHQYISGTTMGK